MRTTLAGTPTTIEPGGTIVIAAGGTGSSPMIPPLAVEVVGRIVADNLYERLAEIGPDMNAIGDRLHAATRTQLAVGS